MWLSGNLETDGQGAAVKHSLWRDARSLRGDRGAALPAVILVALIVMSIVSTLLLSSLGGKGVSATGQLNSAASAAASAGVAEAEAKVRSTGNRAELCPSTTVTGPIAGNDTSYSARIICESDGTFTIESEGYAGDVVQTVSSSTGETAPAEEPHYIVTLDTGLPGCVSPGVNITAKPGSVITVEWQGQSKTVTGATTMTPAVTPGEYQVTFIGAGAQFANSAPVMASCLKSVDRWDAGFTDSAFSAFMNASNLRNVTKPPSGLTSMGAMFYNARSFNQPIDDWDVSSVTSMNSMFQGATSFNQSLDRWDVRRVTDMANMFRGATAFNGAIGSWDVSSVTSMASMFDTAYAFDQPIGDWEVSEVRVMTSMFATARAFNQPLQDWDVSQVTNMNLMFRGTLAFNRDISGWPVAAVTSWSSFRTGSALSTENTPVKFR